MNIAPENRYGYDEPDEQDISISCEYKDEEKNRNEHIGKTGRIATVFFEFRLQVSLLELAFQDPYRNNS